MLCPPGDRLYGMGTSVCVCVYVCMCVCTCVEMMVIEDEADARSVCLSGKSALFRCKHSPESVTSAACFWRQVVCSPLPASNIVLPLGRSNAQLRRMSHLSHPMRGSRLRIENNAKSIKCLNAELHSREGGNGTTRRINV